MTERRDYYLAPKAGEDTEAVLDEALSSLGTLRAMGWATPASTSIC
jgi:hypothetical protein